GSRSAASRGRRERARLASSGWVVAILTVLMVSGAGVTNWVRGFPLASFDGEEIAASGQSSAPQAAPATETKPAVAAKKPASSIAPVGATDQGDTASTPASDPYQATIAAVDRARIEAARAADRLSAATTRQADVQQAMANRQH